jgi:hypothetical protein
VSAIAFTMLYDLYKMGLDALSARFTFRLDIGVSGDPATIFVGATNRTKDTPLVIREVRIHFGHPDLTNAFILKPYEAQQIKPGERREFSIPFSDGCRLTKRVNVARDKYHPSLGDAPPSWEHPAQLFHAITNGDKCASWIEIDFNEFQKRRFRRGKLKPEFQRAVAKWKYAHEKQAA